MDNDHSLLPVAKSSIYRWFRFENGHDNPHDSAVRFVESLTPWKCLIKILEEHIEMVDYIDRYRGEPITFALKEAPYACCWNFEWVLHTDKYMCWVEQCGYKLIHSYPFVLEHSITPLPSFPK